MKNTIIPLSAIALAFLLFTSCNSGSDIKGDKTHEIPQSFNYLKTEKVKGHKNIRVHYNPEIAKAINKAVKKGDPQYQGEGPSANYLVVKTKLQKNDDQEYSLVFSPGPSADPHFRIFKEDKKIYSIAGTELFIPGNGNVYSRGHTNSMFNVKKKFVFTGKTFYEAKQPYYYVGLKTKTTQPIKLYQNMGLSKTIASLPKGAEVEVLLNKGRFYLLRTSFGLTGWIKIDQVMQNSGIDGLYYAGD